MIDLIDYTIIGIIYIVLIGAAILTIRSLRNKTMTKAEFSAVWAVLSIGVGVYGFFRYAIFLGPPALIFGGIGIYYGFKEAELGTLYKILAIIGLLLGAWETGFSIAGLLGLLPPA
ncbi:MAG: hypothetical protein ACTSQI_07890 [Candidatus Helarchaeota archaeon]